MKITNTSNCNILISEDNLPEGFIFAYILQSNASNPQDSLKLIRESEDLEVSFELNQDGFYTLCKIIVPLDETKPYYYKDGSFYKGTEEVLLDELLEVNTEVSQLDITYYYYFLVCRLWKCYIAVCLKILDAQLSIRCEPRNINREDTYKRDLLRSALDVIRYLTECNKFQEALRLLERIMGCNGLCSNNLKPCGCGC